MRFKLITLLLFASFTASAQTQEDDLIKDLIESIAENLTEDYDLSELQDRLNYFKKHPINLNQTNPEELKTLVFLSALQISNFFEHIKVNGLLIDLLELQSIPDFDLKTIQNLLPFVTLNKGSQLDKITWHNLINLSDNDLLLRFGRVIEKQKGYTDLPGSRYLGGQERYFFRYKYNYSNRVSASLIFEKDAGEIFFNGRKQNPFDFQSAHIALFHTGRFKKIVIGDYSMQFGQALTLWSGFGFGKSTDVASIAKSDVGLRPYTSVNEFSFFRGVATTITLVKNLDLTPFYSNRKLDGALNEAIDGSMVVSSVSETGLHRTNTEINNKQQIKQQVAGAVLQYQNNLLSLGAIGYHTQLSNAFITGNPVYRAYNFTGNQLTNFGIYYNYTFKNFYFFGEGANSLNSGFAVLNGALVSLSPTLSAALLYRNYQKNYHSFFNKAIAEATDAVNEEGFYTGINFIPNKRWSISLYGDYFKFPWLKFRVDAPSDGYELLAQTIFTPTKKLKFILRYKSEIKQQNTDLPVAINYLDQVKRESYRLDVYWKLGRSFGFQNRVEVAQYKKGDALSEFGYLVYQDVAFVPMASRFNAHVRLAYFNTPSYNARIYAYEDDVLYNFSFGLYNGKGIRSYFNLKYNIAKHLDFWARYAIFRYQNASSIGSGLDLIDGNLKSDAKLQLRYTF